MISIAKAMVRTLAGGIVLVVGGYGLCVVLAWHRYGTTRPLGQVGNTDEHLELLIPVYDIVERFQLHVRAPAETTFSAARNLHLFNSRLIRALFRTREFVMRGKADQFRNVLGLTDQAKVWGWRLLLEQPGHEVLFGAVTQPWIVKPVFLGLPPAEFRDFKEPGYRRPGHQIEDPRAIRVRKACQPF